MKMYFITKNNNQIETMEFDEEQILADLKLQAQELNIPNYEKMGIKELEAALEKIQSDNQPNCEDLDEEDLDDLDITQYGKKPSKYENKADREYRKYGLNKEHLCSHCEKAYANICPKVAHTRKGELNDYPFVTEGAQVIKEGLVDKFFVAMCKEFVKDDEAKREKMRKEAERMCLLLQRSCINKTPDEPIVQAPKRENSPYKRRVRMPQK